MICILLQRNVQKNSSGLRGTVQNALITLGSVGQTTTMEVESYSLNNIYHYISQ